MGLIYMYRVTLHLVVCINTHDRESLGLNPNASVDTVSGPLQKFTLLATFLDRDLTLELWHPVRADKSPSPQYRKLMGPTRSFRVT